MNATKQSDATERLGLSANAASALLGISIRLIWKLHASERIPQPIRLGRRVIWNKAELLAWMEAGAPSRDEWEARKASAGR